MKEKISLNMEKVKELAFNKKMVWADLARKANITVASVYAFQSGRRNPSQRTVFKIATALEVDPKEIIKHE